MKRLKKTAKIVNIDNEWDLDLDKLKKEILNDFDLYQGDSLESQLGFAKDHDIKFDSIFNDAEMIFYMKEIEKALEDVSKKDLIDGIAMKDIKIDTSDKYIIYTKDGKYKSTPKDLDESMNELANRVYDYIVAAIDKGRFDDIYDSYPFGSLDDALVSKK